MTLTVRCIMPNCPAPAPRTEVTIVELAPGIIASPRLICAGCGGELWEDERSMESVTA